MPPARVRVPEWMDDPALEEGLHRRALRDLARLNAWTGVDGPVWRGVLRAAERGGAGPGAGSGAGGLLRVLDVGTGSGDLLVRLAARSARAGARVELHGCDVSAVALAAARERAASAGVSVVLHRVDVVGEGLAGVEICSIHLHGSDRTDRLIADALFADGAAAAVIRGSGCGDEGVAIRACRSALLPDSEGLMGWRIGDRGFEMTLDARVPERLAEAAPGWIDGVLGGCGLTRGEVGAWAIHPGGPRIVESLRSALGLSAGAVAESMAVLRAHGNMSSGTVLFILGRLMAGRSAGGQGGEPGETGGTGARTPWVAMAFGPGLAAECAVLG